MEYRAIEVAKTAPADGSVTDGVIDADDGQVVLSIESLALTANNVTYALLGDAFGYWRFYPATADGNGRVPAWGFASVVASRAPGIDVGTRWYGFFPVATHVAVDVGQIGPDRFMAGCEHRRDLAAAYNLYRRALPEFGFDESSRIADMVFRPLFTTAFLIAETLDARFKGLPAIISSASSKTALCLGAELTRRGTRRSIGLTSAANVAFTAGLGVYSDVVDYDHIADLANDDSVFVDIAGRDAVRAAVHDRFDSRLALSLAVGAAHGQVPAEPPATGPKPELFFAPSAYGAVVEAMGVAAFEATYHNAWQSFQQLADGWLQTRELNGLDDALAVWPELVAGKVPPRDALIVRLT